jgi:DNA-binding CsgD family transcriptional regulator
LGLSWANHSEADLAKACVHARKAVALAQDITDPALLPTGLATLAFMEFLAGRGLDTTMIERAVSLEPEWMIGTMRPRWIQAMLLEWTGDHHRARAQLERLQGENRGRGEDMEIPFVTNRLAQLALRTGDWERARRLAAETLEQTLQMGLDLEQMFGLATAALVEAYCGRVEAARELAEQGITMAERIGNASARFECLAIRGFIELSLGDMAAASAVLAPLVLSVADAGFDEPVVFRILPDDIEAQIALGRNDEAADQLARFELSAAAHPNPWSVMAVARSRGLLEAATGDSPRALATLGAAHEAAKRLGEPFEVARTRLALGTVQRRAKRWADARHSLEAARQAFERLGARLWTERTNEELARIPGRAPAGVGLTATEQRVAELVAEGRANKEVAATLFVSVKAVEANLSRVYAKLGVRSRGELAHRFARERQPKE